MDVKLVVGCGRAKGRSIPLPGTVFVIGRGDECHLRPHCLRVSKLHCAIACWGGKVVVRDLKSANGTYVNDERIQGETQVRNGDSLRVGSLVFSFQIDPNPTALVPLPKVRASEVQWLFDSTGDVAQLKSSDTWHEDSAALLGPPEATASDIDMSAGAFLRANVDRRPR